MATTTQPDATLLERYRDVRAFTDALIGPLSAEDCMVQSMPDVSPTRWHLAHTTWFFETFILGPQPGYRCFDEQFQYLFNSYYNSVGKQFPRPSRGVISRPGLEVIKEYRAYVDDHIDSLLSANDLEKAQRESMEVGLQHEQQHQELILTDIKHVLSCNPTLPSYADRPFAKPPRGDGGWQRAKAGVYEAGHDGSGFCFDNELPRHKTYIHDHALSRQLVTCQEFVEFIEEGGYTRPELWLSLGWSTVQQQEWEAPLYWLQRDGQWMIFTLSGLVPVQPDWPVCHVSYFEADAYARYRGLRLPTEFEWELAASQLDDSGDGQFADRLMATGEAIHPTAAGNADGSLYGGVWQWTSSGYSAYPGYAPLEGALGEYNGKFMCNQYVLRGGSVATNSNHIRPTYRNFFPPEARWQFSGIRLAE